MSTNLVWIDCEMTGLDLENDVLIEVAALVTDGDLNVLGNGVQVVIRPPDEALAQMNDFVRGMHEKSGLLPLLADGMALADAEQAVLNYVRAHVPHPGKAPLAGNTIGTDRAFLARYMPELEGHVHYRNVDVSSIKELAKRWFPRIFYSTPAKGGNHRALADIQESIEELRYYRETLFIDAPGPDLGSLRRIASSHAGSLTGIEHQGTSAAPAPDSPTTE